MDTDHSVVISGGGGGGYGRINGDECKLDLGWRSDDVL